MEKIVLVIAGIYLGIMAVIDRRRNEIPIIPGLVCMVLIILVQIAGGNRLSAWLPGAGIGAFLFLVGKLSRGGIGEGDALVYVITGITLGFWENLELLIMSLTFASMAGLILLVFRRVGRKHAMPFVPFTAVAYGVMLII